VLYLDKGFYSGMHVTVLRWTHTEFLTKTGKLKPVKRVIDGLAVWNVDWRMLEDYR
jgi:hypothetical protein